MKDQKGKSSLNPEILGTLGNELELDGFPINIGENHFGNRKIRQSEEIQDINSVAATLQSGIMLTIRNIEVEAEFKPIEKHIFVKELERKAIQSSSNLPPGQKTIFNHYFSVNKNGLPFEISCQDIYLFYLTTKLQEKIIDFQSLIETCKTQNQKLIEQLKQKEEWSEALTRSLLYADSLFHFSFMHYLGSFGQTKEQIRGPKDEILDAIKEIDQEMQDKIKSDIKLERNPALRKEEPIDKQAQYLINFIQERGSEELIKGLAVKRQRILSYLTRNITGDPMLKLQELESEIKLEKNQRNEDKKMRIIRLTKPISSSPEQITNSSGSDEASKKNKIDSSDARLINPNSDTKINKLNLLSLTELQTRGEQISKTRGRDLVEQEKQRREQEKKQRDLERQERIKKQEEDRKIKEEEAEKKQAEEKRFKEETKKKQETKIGVEEVEFKRKPEKTLDSPSSQDLIQDKSLKKRNIKIANEIVIPKQRKATKTRGFKLRYLLTGLSAVTILGLIYLLRDQLFKITGINNSSDLPVKNTNQKNSYGYVSKFDLKPERNGNTDLLYSVQEKNLDRVLSLLRSGVNPDQGNHKGTTPLILASQNNYLEILKAILEFGANPNKGDENGNTPLIFAAQGGYLQATEALLKAEADPNQANIDENTPLIISASKGNLKVALALLEAKADPNKIGKNGVTAIISASQYGHREMVRALLSNGANPNRKTDKSRSTALFFSAQNGYREIVKDLLEARADPNQANIDESTPLIIACQNGHIEIVKDLIGAGADPNHTNIDENTALDTAKNEGHLDIAEFLKAKTNSDITSKEKPKNMITRSKADKLETDRQMTRENS